MPSGFLFLLLYIVDKNYNKSNIINLICNILEAENIVIIYILIISLILSTAYIMKISVQLIFDSFLKRSFKPFIKSCCYKDIRDEVIEKLKRVNPSLNSILDNVKKEENDYILYQIIGSIYKINTKEYGDSSKEGGVIALSLMIASSYGFYLKNNLLSIKCILVLLSIWFIGYIYMRSRYISRAYKIYLGVLNDKYELYNEVKAIKNIDK